MTTPTTLPPGHVHLWHAVLPSPAASREPALRAILARYLRWPAEVLPLDATTHSLAGLHFSTTVSARHALIAIAREPAIGIDLEFIRHDIPVDELAAGYFDPRDEWEIRTARGDQRAARFFELWTCREARLKAAGPCVVRSIDAPPGCAAAIALPLDNRLVCWEMAAQPLFKESADSADDRRLSVTHDYFNLRKSAQSADNSTRVNQPPRPFRPTVKSVVQLHAVPA